MNNEYHILYFKDGMILFLIATMGVANKLYLRDRAINKMSSFYTLEEILDYHFATVMFNMPPDVNKFWS